MMQTFIYGLLLAGVSATSVIAFKHPLGYARLFPYLLGLVSLVFAGIILWHVAVEMAWLELTPFLVKKSLTDAEQTMEQLTLPYLGVGLWYLGLVAFFWVNLRLPHFLQVADGRQAEEERTPQK